MTAAARFATSAASPAHAGFSTPYISANSDALACAYAACDASAASNATALGNRFGGDQNVLPLLVRASSGNMCTSCAILWLKRSSNWRRLMAMQSSKVAQRLAETQSEMASRLTRAVWSPALRAAAAYAVGSFRYALTSARRRAMLQLLQC